MSFPDYLLADCLSAACLPRATVRVRSQPLLAKVDLRRWKQPSPRATVQLPDLTRAEKVGIDSAESASKTASRRCQMLGRAAIRALELPELLDRSATVSPVRRLPLTLRAVMIVPQPLSSLNLLDAEIPPVDRSELLCQSCRDRSPALVFRQSTNPNAASLGQAH